MKKQTNKIQAIRQALNAAFKERSSLVDGMLVALLSREMLFMLGEPGTAKSAICETLCRAFDGNYFSYLMGKFTTPEEIYGPLSLKGLEQDKYERIVAGKLPAADVAFLDEIFKGSSAILNTLLPVINERIFRNGSQDPKIPLQVLFGASNEIPQAEELAALYDRFVLRYNVMSMQNDASLADLLVNGLKAQIPTVTKAELAEEQAKVQDVKVSNDIVQMILNIRRTIKDEGLFVSDRKWMQAMRVIKAFAHLNGHAEVQEDDVQMLENVLWQSPDQQKTVRKIVGKFCNPLGEKIMKIMDAMVEVNQNLSSIQNKDSKDFMSAAHEAAAKAKDAVKQLTALGNPDGNKKLQEAIAMVKKIQNKIVDDLGITRL